MRSQEKSRPLLTTQTTFDRETSRLSTYIKRRSLAGALHLKLRDPWVFFLFSASLLYVDIVRFTSQVATSRAVGIWWWPVLLVIGTWVPLWIFVHKKTAHARERQAERGYWRKPLSSARRVPFFCGCIVYSPTIHKKEDYCALGSFLFLRENPSP